MAEAGHEGLASLAIGGVGRRRPTPRSIDARKGLDSLGLTHGTGVALHLPWPRETTMAEGGDMTEAQVAARAAKEMTR